MVRTYLNGFRSLVAWQRAHSLAISIYQITKSFPNEEKFGLTSQLRRSASSVAANIAEGSGRKTDPDRRHFYVQARGSLVEVDNFLQLAHDLGMLGKQEYESTLEEVNKTGFLLSKLIQGTGD